MQHIVIRLLLLSVTLFILKCTNALNSEPSDYNSIHLKGGGWLQFNGPDINSYISNNFSLQLWVSGDTEESSDSKTLLSILDENNNNQVIFGLFRNTTVNNAIDVYLDGAYIDTITDDNLDWTKTIFNLITITSEEEDNGNNLIKIFINDAEGYRIEDTDLQIGNNDLIIGGKVNSSQTEASNFWTGYIDEIRLWNVALTADEINFHFTNSYKLISSTDNSETDIIEGSYEDPRLCGLVGLWRFNYNSPTSYISDESCLELGLSSGTSNHLDCECQDINGTIYTLPGFNVEFSKVSL